MIQIQKKMKKSKSDFVHRDLKPQNILVSNEGSVKITDFGLAKIIGENALKLGSIPKTIVANDGHLTFGTNENICGTPPYMSPEQCKGTTTLDQRSDIYSFGCILYEMCSKNFIFQVRSPSEFISKHIHEPPIPIKKWNSNLPKSLVVLIEKCLSKSPSDRPQNFREIRDFLEEILKSTGGSSLLFFVCGLSGLTDRPRVKTDWNLRKGHEAILFSDLGIDYLIEQGLVESKAEFEKMKKEYDQSRAIRQKEAEEYKKFDEINESIHAGDAFLDLSEAAEEQEKANIVRAAISKYYSAQERAPMDPEISYRLGMANKQLAALIYETNRSLCEDIASLAIEELNSVLKNQTAPATYPIGSRLYLLPFDALFDRAGALLLKGEIENAAKDLKLLLCWLEKADLSEFLNSISKSVSKQFKERALEGLKIALGKIGNKGNDLDDQARFEEAIQCYDIVIELDPHDPEIDQLIAGAWYSKATAEDSIGRKSNAIQSFKKFITMATNEDMKMVHYVRKRLEELEGS
jgi:tetratricopeptide (TPR) repeat protein